MPPAPWGEGKEEGLPVVTAIDLMATGVSNTRVKWSVREAFFSEAKKVSGSPSKAYWRICPGAVLRVVWMIAPTEGSGGVAEKASAETGMVRRHTKPSRLERRIGCFIV
jgi:hypothetical protein